MESSSSSSSKHLPEEDNQKIRANQVVSNCLIVLPLSVPQFIHASPSSKQPITPNFKSLLTQSTTHILHNFHNSILSTTDKCLKLFHSLASQNPFLSKVVSLSSDLQNFCQIHRRNYQNLDSLSHHNFAAILPGDSVAGVVAANGILNFLNIYNTLLVCRLVLTWFPNSPPAIVSPLSTLCDPYLNIFRGLIPPLGGTLDLSPILAFLVLNAFTSAASALPAELPSEGTPRSELHHLTTSQRKWMRRFAAKPPKSSSNDH